MCIACEMFWMAAEEPPPAPKRKARKARSRAGETFACDPVETGRTKPAPRRASPAPRGRAARTRASAARE